MVVKAEALVRCTRRRCGRRSLILRVDCLSPALSRLSAWGTKSRTEIDEASGRRRQGSQTPRAASDHSPDDATANDKVSPYSQTALSCRQAIRHRIANNDVVVTSSRPTSSERYEDRKRAVSRRRRLFPAVGLATRVLHTCSTSQRSFRLKRKGIAGMLSAMREVAFDISTLS